MHSVFDGDAYLVKEHKALFKASNNYDVYDLQSGQIVAHCREEKLGAFTKIVRFTKHKKKTPFHVDLRTPAGEPLASVTRGWAFFRSLVTVTDASESVVGRFQQRLLSWTPKFEVLGPDNQLLCDLRGKWTGWDFRFMHGETQLGRVTKKWAGLGKEMFTSADNYAVEISPDVPPGNPLRLLILTAAICVDMVLHE